MIRVFKAISTCVSENKSIKCVLAKCGIGVENAGHVKLCNASIDVFKDPRGNPYRLDETGLQEIWDNTVTRREINDSLDQGIRHDNCRLCWDAEDSGVKSIRQVTNDAFPDVEPMENQPRVAILKPGNLCNFACRTCNVEATNQLYDIDYKLRKKPSGLLKDTETVRANEKLTYEEYVKTFESQRKSFHKDSGFWNVMDNWSDGILHYALFGGEPFVMKPLFDMLNRSYETGGSAKQDLYVSTNCSVWSEKYIEIIKSFKSAMIGISIDAVGDQFEYIRHPGKWLKIKTNILKFVKLREDNPHIKLKVSATCNPFNIYYLDELYDFFKEVDIPIDIHLIQIPECYDIRILPEAVKEAITKKHQHREDLAHVLTFLNSQMKDAELYLKDFIYLTKGTDKIRNEKFGDAMPEFNKILVENGIII
tara:strand:- start:1088 stop:2353 length:1266 start_codon:yes stop_codon:yes gene_type:complete